MILQHLLSIMMANNGFIELLMGLLWEWLMKNLKMIMGNIIRSTFS